MNGITKFLIGGLATSLMAMAAVNALGVDQTVDGRRAAKAEAAATSVSDAAPPAASAAAVKDCQADVDAVIKGKTIQFDSGAASIRAESVPLIDALAAALGPCNGTSVAIAGHTDATGSPKENQALSETRAKAVAAELINRGVPAGRLVPAGYGSTKALQPGASAAAHAVNRRIEFVVASAAAPTAP